MKFQIFYTVSGEEDSFVVEGDDLATLQEQAAAGVEQRGGTDPYSVPLD